MSPLNLEDLFALFEMTKGPNQLRPALIGPTGTGKTERVNAYAKAIGLPVVQHLLSHQMPEEVGGLPFVQQGLATHEPPEWAVRASKEPMVIFFDELDKARRETTGAVLTLLWDFKLRDLQLHPDCRIIVAMQPVDPRQFLATETGKALAARCLWLPLPYDWGYVGEKIGADLTDFPSPAQMAVPVPPIPSPRQVEQATSLFLRAQGDSIRSAVLNGILPEQLGAKLRERLDAKVVVTPETLCGLVQTNRADIQELNITELITISGKLANEGPIAQYANAIYRVWTEGAEEDAAAFLKTQYEYLLEKCKADPEQKVAFLGDTPVEEIIRVLSKVSRAIGELWIERNNGRPLPAPVDFMAP